MSPLLLIWPPFIIYHFPSFILSFFHTFFTQNNILKNSENNEKFVEVRIEKRVTKINTLIGASFEAIEGCVADILTKISTILLACKLLKNIITQNKRIYP